MTQPAPTTSPRSRPVFESLERAIRTGGDAHKQVHEIDFRRVDAAIQDVVNALGELGVNMTAQLLELVEQRKERGRQTYGGELMTHNGRDAARDAIEELADALVYLWQRRMEFAPDDGSVNRVETTTPPTTEGAP